MHKPWMGAGKPVDFFFDFISPYSYVASQLIAREAAFRAINLVYRPVIFGTVLSKLEKKGPGEIPIQRRLGLQDILNLCALYDIPIEGPPTHPFNSIYALRSVCAVQDPDIRAKLAQRYFRETWQHGKSLENLDVLKKCLVDLGIDQDPEDAATTKENRVALKTNTKRLLEVGGWGVPTFTVDDQVFFGHDRLALLAAYLDGKFQPRTEKLEEMLARPQPGRIT